MASLFTRKGTYYAEFFDARRKPKAKRISLKTQKKQEARRRLVELETKWHDGRFDPWKESPWAQAATTSPERIDTTDAALSAFLRAKMQEGRAQATLDNYRSFCGLFIRKVGERRRLDAITSADVEVFVRDSSISNESCRTRYRHLRAWLTWCRRKGMIDRDLFSQITPLSRSEKMPKAVRVRDLEQIESAIREDYSRKRERNEVEEGDLIWMIPLFRFGLYSGLRASELARLKWSHLDFDSDQIRILEQKNRKEQTVPLTAPARSFLEQLRPGRPEDFVFRAPGSDPCRRHIRSFRCNLARKFKRYAKTAGITGSLTPHGLRHGFCTILAEAGKSAPIIKEAARHSDISTSMRYVHIANHHLKKELDEVFSSAK